MEKELLLPVFDIFQGEYPQYLGFHEFKDKFDAHFNIDEFLESNNCEINDKINLNIDSIALENMTMPKIIEHISSRIIIYVIDNKNVVYNLDIDDVEIHDLTFSLHKVYEDKMIKNNVVVDFTIKEAIVKEDTDFKYKQIHYAVKNHLEEENNNKILENKNIKPFLKMTTNEFNAVVDTGFIDPSIVKALRAERKIEEKSKKPT